MAGFIGSKAHTGLAVPAWLLAFAGFAILLGGISAMQKGCGGSGGGVPNVGVNQPIPPGMGAVSYLAPVSCDRFFSFDWFILFFHFFVWILVAIFLFSRKVHLARAMLTSLLAVVATLLMFTANTWYRINGVGSGLSGTFKSRARTAFAGAIICSIADLLLLIILGLHDEKDTERFETKERVEPVGGAGLGAVRPAGYRPTGAETTTTTTNVQQGPTTVTSV